MGQPPETSKPAEEQPAAEPAVEQQPAATMTETPSGSELVTIALTSGEPMATLKFAMSRKDISEPRYADRLPESHPAHDMLGVLSFVALTKIKAITLTLTDTSSRRTASRNPPFDKMVPLRITTIVSTSWSVLAGCS
jgi:hypothetical protein